MNQLLGQPLRHTALRTVLARLQDPLERHLGPLPLRQRPRGQDVLRGFPERDDLHRGGHQFDRLPQDGQRRRERDGVQVGQGVRDDARRLVLLAVSHDDAGQEGQERVGRGWDEEWIGSAGPLGEESGCGG